MADNTAALIAQISALQEEVTTVSAERDALDQQLTQVEAQLATTTAEAAGVPALQAQIAYLEGLLAPPPPQSGIVTVTYSDGRTKYAAPDGDKFVLAADAEHHAKILKLIDLYGMNEAQAEMVLARGFEPA
jgi:hypothetical protein